MGAVKVMLSEINLEDRERHNSRLFVDLCENIHIHYREYRFVFSLPEYFEFVDIVSKSTEDVRNYLLSNTDYKEKEYKTTLMVAGGKERQMKFLENSPQPNCSEYFNNSLRIELQEEYVTDEIHIHYRDFRLALNRDNFKDIAASFTEAHDKLIEFENNNEYVRDNHSDRDVSSWAQSDDIALTDTETMGIQSIKLADIQSHWYRDILTEWNPDPKIIKILKNAYSKSKSVQPIVLLKEDGYYKIVDGHHRVRAALELDMVDVDSVVLTDLTWEQTESLRKAEVLLKQFDKDTSYRFNVCSFYKHYIAHSMNEYYSNHFHNITKSPSGLYAFLKGIKNGILKLPIPNNMKRAIANVSGSKKYWR